MDIEGITKRTPREIAESHAFAGWISNLSRWGTRIDNGKDVVLDDASSKRFAVGLEDGTLVLGVQPRDMKALETIPWTSAALLRDLKGADWIALSCRDVRPYASDEPFDVTGEERVPLRLFVRLAGDRADAVEDAGPKTLKLRVFKVSGSGKPVLATAPVQAEIPMMVKSAKKTA